MLINTHTHTYIDTYMYTHTHIFIHTYAYSCPSGQIHFLTNPSHRLRRKPPTGIPPTRRPQPRFLRLMPLFLSRTIRFCVLLGRPQSGVAPPRYHRCCVAPPRYHRCGVTPTRYRSCDRHRHTSPGHACKRIPEGGRLAGKG